MTYRRRQTVGNIQYIVESNFKDSDAASTEDLLTVIMINRAKEALHAADQSEAPIPQNEIHTINKLQAGRYTDDNSV